MEENGAAARGMAAEGMVLLRNEGGLLPLQPDQIKSVALIGPAAMKAMTGGGGSSHVQPVYSVNPLEGLQKALGSNVKVTLNSGSDVAGATALAQASDVAIVMVGDNESEGRDNDLNFPTGQNELVEAIAAANKRTIVVIKSGGAILLPWGGQGFRRARGVVPRRGRRQRRGRCAAGPRQPLRPAADDLSQINRRSPGPHARAVSLA